MAAQYGTVVLVTAMGNKSVDAYFDDTAGNPVRFDGGSGASATSPDSYSIPGGGGVIVDVILAAATGQTKTQINKNNQATGVILRNSLHLASVVTRPQLMLSYRAGDQLTMTQLA